jgi:DNA-binding helix-hairpin-helix protein with protein kinase domain
LRSFGIETALDVTPEAIQLIPGIGEALTWGLLGWRRTVESQFHYEPKMGVPPGDLQQLDFKYMQRRFELERRLQQEKGQLQRISDDAKRDLIGLANDATSRRFAVDQAKSDLAVAGITHSLW